MTSGTNTGALRPYTARQMLEAALRRCGIKPPQFNSDMVEIAFDTFNTMLDEMPNLGMQLWARDDVVMPIYAGRNMVPTPLGTSVILNCRQRTMFRPTPFAVYSDNGGVAEFAFDDNFDTECRQASVGGTLTAIYDQPTYISSVGILFTEGQKLALFVEYDLKGDGNWVALDAYEVEPQEQEWVWKDLQGAPHAIGWRIRSVGPTAMIVSELFFGNTPSEVPMGVWTQDDWDNMVIKDTPGAPWNWFQDRQLATPVLFLWPKPDMTCRYMTIVCRRRRYLEQVSDMSQVLDVSRRWNEALTASLARRLCREIPEADLKRYQLLLSEEATAMQLAQAEERDPAPMRYNPGLEVYDA